MEDVTVAVRGKLTRSDASDIDLLVHSYCLGRPSPCVVVENSVNRGLIGGHIENLEEILDLEVARHP